jgi:hypothetical protein
MKFTSTTSINPTKDGVFGMLVGWGGLNFPPVYEQSKDKENQTKICFHFQMFYIRIEKVNECQGNGITLDGTKTQIKRVRALLAPPSLIGLGQTSAYSPSKHKHY